MGFGRDTFYRIKKAYEEGGIEALYEESRRKLNLKAVVELALEDPSLGQKRVGDELWSIWLRHGLGMDSRY